MTDAALPDAILSSNGSALTPPQVAEQFLRRLAASDLDGALELIDDDILYTNVSLPSVKGKRMVRRVLSGLDRPGSSFEVYFHSIAADDGTVLPERTDVIVIGRLRFQFWVWGRFDVRNGRITL